MIAPKLSVLMALYNAAPYVEKALKSVLTQDFGDFELLICDDGSGDGSAQIVADMAEEDTRIRVLSNGKNRGYTPTMNRLFGEARGEYIAIMDADDLCSPNRFAKQLDFIKTNPNTNMVGTWATLIDADGKPTGGKTGFNHRRCDDKYIKERAGFGYGLLFPTLLFRRNLLVKDRLGFNPAMVAGVDDEFIIRALATTKAGLLFEPLYFYRQHGEQVTGAAHWTKTRLSSTVANFKLFTGYCGVQTDDDTALHSLWGDKPRATSAKAMLRLVKRLLTIKKVYEYDYRQPPAVIANVVVGKYLRWLVVTAKNPFAAGGRLLFYSPLLFASRPYGTARYLAGYPYRKLLKLWRR